MIDYRRYQALRNRLVVTAFWKVKQANIVAQFHGAMR
jgi:hypothetical protein